jgi:5-methylcytosine-specific restriction protein A
MKLGRIPNRLAQVAYSCISPARQVLQGQAPTPAATKRPWERVGPDTRKLRGRALMKKREQIALRDKYTCQCGCRRVVTLQEGELDHRIPLCQGGKDTDDNLQWLAKEPCHAAKTARENNQQRRGW